MIYKVVQVKVSDGTGESVMWVPREYARLNFSFILDNKNYLIKEVYGNTETTIEKLDEMILEDQVNKVKENIRMRKVV